MNDTSGPPRGWRHFIRAGTDFVILGTLVGLVCYAIVRGLLRTVLHLLTLGLP